MPKCVPSLQSERLLTSLEMVARSSLAVPSVLLMTSTAMRLQKFQPFVQRSRLGVDKKNRSRVDTRESILFQVYRHVVVNNNQEENGDAQDVAYESKLPVINHARLCNC